MTARHIFMTAGLLLVLSAAPAFAQTATSTTATTAAAKPDVFSRLFGNKSAASNTSTMNAAAANKSQTQRHVHTYLARNYDHRHGHTYTHGKGAVGTTAATPVSSSGGFFSRFKKSTSQ